MKLSLFTEVQCSPGTSPTQLIEELIEQAELADALGFDSFWLAEIHFQPAFSLLSAPYPVLGALSQRTRRLRLGIAVNVLPVHHPIHLAEQAAMLDLLSHGRLDFAIGRGHMHTRVYEGFGVKYKQSRALVEENLQVILAAWTQDILEFQGRFYSIPGVLVHPKPVQRPHPPIYTAATSSEGVEMAARLGLNVLLTIHIAPRERIRSEAATYWNSLRSHGHDASKREMGVLIPLYIGETTDKAQQEAGEGVLDYYRVIADTREDYNQWLVSRGMNPLPPPPYEGITMERLCAEHAILSDPATARAQLKQLADELGATHLLCWMNIGSVPHQRVLESMERFAREVMPYLTKGT